MTNDTSVLDLIMARFPEHSESLEHLYVKSESFRTLCDDIRECLATLETWSQSMAEEAPVYRKEFATLLQELEEEVLQIVESERSYQSPESVREL
ncbi:MAG: hypothetical protein ABFD97_04275 [Syntrophobacter sp.]